ncbi:MAG: hypothetical protein GWM92_15740 [Gemmatimonadetes bacterium]|nr:hypothetical protein [Gemmatimonadota bacterium]NIR80184.1 hypothetical protein [Gemmatimonadota bacterium]NIT88946.1 hypothetical protein [Gemmatimonadota bacterium]NIU32741.1 hypothetical protein [Gemmatimonadota bacterium]NIU37173.1 hypothetical protein [Gemmatimonadota bacterium]
MEEQAWYDELLTAAADSLRETFSGFEAEGEIAGVDFTLGRAQGPPWELVAAGAVLLLVVFLVIGAFRS